jgi:anti-sigma regulatory factor (Ser/Thr protein kinase)
MNRKRFFDKLREYHFEFKHLTILFIVLFLFQLLVSFITKTSIQSFLGDTQEWYQKDSAERLANLTATSLELLLESINPDAKVDEEEKIRIVQSFNIILSQQVLQNNIEDMCIIVSKGDKIYAIDDGLVLYSFLMHEEYNPPPPLWNHSRAIDLYNSIQQEIRAEENIFSIPTNNQTFHTFVPFVIRGEFIGAVYMKNTPDFSFLTDQIISSYDETSVIYLSLILLGLLAMYFISSYTVKERDEVQKQLMIENENSIKKQINYEKELLFTKRIYHTHHKAEKVMGFIKEDLRALEPLNMEETKYRVGKYSNFISRVIYDMKWFDPPIQTIRNQLFVTDLNEVLCFIINNIFLRLSTSKNTFEILTDLQKIPTVHVNEFVAWEIFEPLIQNSIDHGGERFLTVKISTLYSAENNKSFIIIEDDGQGISPELMELNELGLKKIFLENVTTKSTVLQSSGYGCYIAYQMSKRCGWDLDVENKLKGCKFIITISN